MKRVIVMLFVVSINFICCQSQTLMNKQGNMRRSAVLFMQTLSSKQKDKIQFGFTDEERYNWHYVPIARKGMPLKEMDDVQTKAAFDLLHSALSDTGLMKTKDIIKLEGILREAESRPANDEYRDQGKYYFSIFGNPTTDSIWGWRFEGHHIAFNFSSEDGRLVSGTPGFFGANPAVVLSGPEKGMEVLKDETDLGYAMLNSLETTQKNKAIISASAPAEIITGSDRKAMISDLKGISYGELSQAQQKIFMQLLSVYIHRYTHLFALTMMQEIENAGLNNLRFAWAGDLQPGPGHPHYYRIQGPTIIIEYDNTQNNANHVHAVIRDLKNDFGGDVLMKHYNDTKHQ